MEPGKLYRDSELPPGFERETAPQPTVTTLVSFRDGSYKKVRHVSWKHSQWIHFKLADGSTVAVNPANVNYLHIED
jgi:hypothetical protein